MNNLECNEEALTREGEDEKGQGQVDSSLQCEEIKSQKKKTLIRGKRTGRTKPKHTKVTVTYRRKLQVKKIRKIRTKIVDKNCSCSTEFNEPVDDSESFGQGSNSENEQYITDSEGVGEKTTQVLKLKTQTPTESNKNKIGIQRQVYKVLKSKDTGNNETCELLESIIASRTRTSAPDKKSKGIRCVISDFLHREQGDRSKGRLGSISTQKLSSVPNLGVKSSKISLDLWSQERYVRIRGRLRAILDKLTPKETKPDEFKDLKKLIMNSWEPFDKTDINEFASWPPGLPTIWEDEERVCALQLRPKCPSEGYKYQHPANKALIKPTDAKSYPEDRATKRWEKDEKVANFLRSSCKEKNEKLPAAKGKSDLNHKRGFTNMLRRIRFSGGNRVFSELLTPIPVQSKSTAADVEEKYQVPLKLNEKVKKDKVQQKSGHGCFSFLTGKIDASRSAIRSLWSTTSFRNRAADSGPSLLMPLSSLACIHDRDSSRPKKMV